MWRPGILCVHTAGFALRAQGAPEHLPAVVLRDGYVVEANALAREMGVVPLVPRSAVSAICPQAVLLQEDVEAARQLRVRWLDRCARLALATEPIDENTLLLDWRGFADGGRGAIRTLFAEARRMGISIRAGHGVGRATAQIAVRAAEQSGRSLVVIGHPLRDSLWPLPLRLLSEVRASVVERCERLGWKRFGDLASVSLSTVRALVGEEALPIWYLAQGVDSARVAALYPPPQWERQGDFDHPLTEESVRFTWYQVAAALAHQSRQLGRGIAEIHLLLVDERGGKHNLQRILRDSISDEQAIYAQILRLWQTRPASLPPISWRVRAVWASRCRAQQMQIDTSSLARREMEHTVQFLQRRFGKRACFLLSQQEPDWSRRMRSYYEPTNLSVYHSGNGLEPPPVSGSL